MARNAQTLDEILEEAVSAAMRRLVPALQRQIAEMVAARIDEEVSRGGGKGRAKAPAARRARKRPEEITRWVPDRRARRVPRFVIEMTGGLDTKKKILTRFAPDAVFEKSKPLPKQLKAA